MNLMDYPVHMRDIVDRSILTEQELIGWDNAMKGFLSTSWMDLASIRYEDTRVDRTAGAQCIRRSLQALYTYTTGV